MTLKGIGSFSSYDESEGGRLYWAKTHSTSISLGWECEIRGWQSGWRARRWWYNRYLNGCLVASFVGSGWNVPLRALGSFQICLDAIWKSWSRVRLSSSFGQENKVLVLHRENRQEVVKLLKKMERANYLPCHSVNFFAYVDECWVFPIRIICPSLFFFKCLHYLF